MNNFRTHFSTITSRIQRPSFFSRSIVSPNKLILIGILILVIIGAIYWVGSIVSALNKPSGSSDRIEVAPPRSTQTINKEFSFSLKDQKGAEVSKLKFVIENAELRDEIIVKGQRATLPVNRVFLILNVKITNDFNKSVQINTRDYVRLIVNGNEKELLAPEVHNDPLEVQATSTKFTRMGFALNLSDKNLKLRIGEVDQKDKTTIDLHFK